MKDAFLYCNENMLGMKFFYEQANEVVLVRDNLIIFMSILFKFVNAEEIIKESQMLEKC